MFPTTQNEGNLKVIRRFNQKDDVIGKFVRDVERNKCSRQLLYYY